MMGTSDASDAPAAERAAQASFAVIHCGARSYPWVRLDIQTAEIRSTELERAVAMASLVQSAAKAGLANVCRVLLEQHDMRQMGEDAARKLARIRQQRADRK